ncbi:MAG: Fe2+ transport protein FeoA [Candidatus Midichloria mitochondrii]|nr:ferrous iron transport protein A [Candidatus Midichloria mitochondrii]MDJ1288168.1 ferrous iron transport protein A [Candidatus Midichloria mitochondrii]MDJ1299052.1 ferrous iron transport protein A [Candidatus Midichloria mitochondrii]MDJ1313222.1 ferrous iron transport protein A [Candidatus Midichloria mitochondrii]
MLIPMSLLESGASAVVESLSFSRDMLQRLLELGIKPGVRFNVVLKNSDFIIKLDENRIAIDKVLCNNIIVSLA